MGFKEQKDKLVEILEELKGAGGATPLKDVFGYMEPSINEHPVAMVSFSDGGISTRLDSESNLLTSKFNIYITFRQSKSTTDENNKLTTLDTVLDKFNTFTNIDTLGGVCHKFEIESINPFEIGEPYSIMGFRIQVSCSEIYILS